MICFFLEMYSSLFTVNLLRFNLTKHTYGTFNVITSFKIQKINTKLTYKTNRELHCSFKQSWHFNLA